MNFILISIKKKNFLIFVLLLLINSLFYSEKIYADFKNLSQEYLEKNLGIEKQRLTIEQDSYNYNISQARTSFVLTLDSFYDKNEKAQASSLSPQTTTQNHTLGLQKEFSFGTTLSVAQSFTKKEINSSSNFFQKNPYAMESSITLSQDLGKNLFGRDYKKDLEIKAHRTMIQKAILDSKIESDLFSLYIYYLNGQLAQKMILLQQQAIKRAVQRKNVIQKRVKDGLLDEVDLLEVEQLLMKQQEAEELANQSLNKILSHLSNQLHRTVQEKEIPPLDQINRSMAAFDNEGSHLSKEIYLILENIEGTKKEIEKINYALTPEISLYGQLKTNQYGDNQSETFKDSMPGNSRKESVIGLKVSYPLGQYAPRAEREKLKIKLKSYESELIKTKINIEELKQKSMNEFDLLQKLHSSTNQRKTIAEKSLKIQNRLYDLGKKEIEFIIKAEENLIDVEKTLAELNTKIEQEFAHYLILNGRFSSFIFDEGNSL